MPDYKTAPADVIMAIIDLAGGLNPSEEFNLIAWISDLVYKKRFSLQPPALQWKKIDPDLYERSLEFYKYCTTPYARGCYLYWDDFVQPEVDKRVKQKLELERKVKQQKDT